MVRTHLLVYLPLILILLFTGYTDAEEITIIANHNVIQDHISKKEVKKIFEGRQKTWDDGSNITVTIYKDNKIFRKFLAIYVNTNPTQFKNVWRRLIFTGKVTSDQIQIFPSEEEAVSYVRNTTGAIGFTHLENIPSDLKIIKIGE